jgi:hypothetical protein
MRLGIHHVFREVVVSRVFRPPPALSETLALIAPPEVLKTAAAPPPRRPAKPRRRRDGYPMPPRGAEGQGELF